MLMSCMFAVGWVNIFAIVVVHLDKLEILNNLFFKFVFHTFIK